MSWSSRFAKCVAAELRDTNLSHSKGRYYKVVGQLEATATFARIEILVPWSFSKLKSEPPEVLCSEPWMKMGSDWHNGKTGMCWVIPNEWQDAMNWPGKPVSSIITEGRDWLLRNVRLLIDRHHYAHLKGLTEWPREWPAWGHGRDGVMEYQAELRDKHISPENETIG